MKLKHTILIPVIATVLLSIFGSYTWRHKRLNGGYNDDIILVNIGNLDRAGIAKQIEILTSYGVSVIAINAIFSQPKHSADRQIDSLLIAGDSALCQAFRNAPNVILGARLQEDSVHGYIPQISHPIFQGPNIRNGYFTFIEKRDLALAVWLTQTLSDSIAKVKNARNKQFPAFGLAIVESYNRTIANVAKRRPSRPEIIDTRELLNVVMDSAATISHPFAQIDVDQLLNEEFEENIFRGKIAILGFMGFTFDNKEDLDMENVLGANGRTRIYSTELQGYVVKMILENSYIKHNLEELTGEMR